ncbi:hypothetical protein FJ656_35270, partial [Schumannella luteola]
MSDGEPAAAPGEPPRFGRMVWRMFWIEAVGGIGVAAILGVIGTLAADGDQGLLLSLLPAVVLVGFGMALPPFLFGMLSLAAASGRPRRMRKEIVAVVIGAVVGGFLSPIIFYSASPLFGIVIGAVV